MGVKGAKQTTVYRFENGKRIRALPSKDCDTCGKTFNPKDYLYKYCSRPCYWQMKRIRGDRAVITEEGLQRIRAAKLGSLNPQWRGGVTPEKVKSRNTMAYKAWRKAVYERDNYTCQDCGKRGGWLEADHIIAWWKDDSKRFDVSNGRTLCRPCHKMKTVAEMRGHWANQFIDKRTGVNEL